MADNGDSAAVDRDYADGYAAGVVDATRGKAMLTDPEMDALIADGDTYALGYRDGLRDAR